MRRSGRRARRPFFCERSEGAHEICKAGDQWPAVAEHRPQHQRRWQHVIHAPSHHGGVRQHQVQRGRADAHFDVVEVPIPQCDNSNHDRQVRQNGQDFRRHHIDFVVRQAALPAIQRHRGDTWQQTDPSQARPVTSEIASVFIRPLPREQLRRAARTLQVFFCRRAGDDVRHQKDEQRAADENQPARGKIWLEQWATNHRRVQQQSHQKDTAHHQ